MPSNLWFVKHFIVWLSVIKLKYQLQCVKGEMKHKELHLLSREIASAELDVCKWTQVCFIFLCCWLVCSFVTLSTFKHEVHFFLQTMSGCKTPRLNLGYLVHNNKYQRAQKWTVRSMAAGLEYVSSLWNYWILKDCALKDITHFFPLYLCIILWRHQT